MCENWHKFFISKSRKFVPKIWFVMLILCNIYHTSYLICNISNTRILYGGEARFFYFLNSPHCVKRHPHFASVLTRPDIVFCSIHNAFLSILVSASPSPSLTWPAYDKVFSRSGIHCFWLSLTLFCNTVKYLVYLKNN